MSKKKQIRKKRFQIKPVVVDSSLSNESVLSSLRGGWATIKPRNRHWIVNVVVGIAIGLVLLYFHSSKPLIAAQNSALDKMMRINAKWDVSPNPNKIPPLQTYIDIDDTTWRSAWWDGGEPYRAPRGKLLELIAKSFEQGAKQVVLDILVEGESNRQNEVASDRQFADGLLKLLEQKGEDGKLILGNDRQLILVRSLRAPIDNSAILGDHKKESSSDVIQYLNQLRASPAVDEVVKKSQGRIAIAAPYFTRSEDLILRDWELFQLVCQPFSDGRSGQVRIVPSVQLLILSKYLNVQLPNPSLENQHNCMSFGSTINEHSLKAEQRPESGEVSSIQKIYSSYWKSLSNEFSGAIRFAEHVPHIGDVGNRIVFRSEFPFQKDDGFFKTLRPEDLLNLKSTDSLQGQIVIIGQSFRESGDMHETPLGLIPGSVVIMNSIDSIIRYGLISPPNKAIILLLELISIVFVGYVYARWDSVLGTVICTTVILSIFAGGSFYLFRYGVWLDFALPLVGIQLHRIIKSFEEWVERSGNSNQHNELH